MTVTHDDDAHDAGAHDHPHPHSGGHSHPHGAPPRRSRVVEPGVPLADMVASRPILGRFLAFRGRLWDVVSERVDLGGEVVTRDFIDHPGSVAIVAYREPGEVLVQLQYRHAVGRELWEAPAGILDMPSESPLDAAKRELFEEAGLVADTWHVLVDVLTTPGGSAEAMRVFLARDMHESPEDARFEREAEERDLVARWISVEEAVDAVLSGRFANPTAVAGFLALDVARRAAWEPLRPADAPWSRPERGR